MGEELLTGEALLTLAGVVAFIEVLFYVLVNPALNYFAPTPDGESTSKGRALAQNVITVILGEVGAFLGLVITATPLTGAVAGDTALLGLFAAFTAIGGYELVKNVTRK